MTSYDLDGRPSQVEINRNARIDGAIQVSSRGGLGGRPGKGGDGEGRKRAKTPMRMLATTPKMAEMAVQREQPGNGERSGTPEMGDPVETLSFDWISKMPTCFWPFARPRKADSREKDFQEANRAAELKVEKAESALMVWSGPAAIAMKMAAPRGMPGITMIHPAPPRTLPAVPQGTHSLSLAKMRMFEFLEGDVYTWKQECVPQPDIPAVRCTQVPKQVHLDAINCLQVEIEEESSPTMATVERSPRANPGADSPATARPGPMVIFTYRCGR